MSTETHSQQKSPELTNSTIQAKPVVPKITVPVLNMSSSHDTDNLWGIRMQIKLQQKSRVPSYIQTNIMTNGPWINCLGLLT